MLAVVRIKFGALLDFFQEVVVPHCFFALFRNIEPIGKEENIADDPDIPDRPDQSRLDGVDDGHQPERNGGYQANSHEKKDHQGWKSMGMSVHENKRRVKFGGSLA